MGRFGLILLVAGCVALSGCVSSQPLPAREAFPVAQPVNFENPLFLGQGPEGYPLVFSQVYRAVETYFPVARSNIYAGTIESEPVVTAGFWDATRFGFYSFDQLYESSLQSIRRRVLVTITPAESGGYFVELQVLKELEDLAHPVHAHAGGNTFRYETPFEKTYDVIDLPYVTKGWIPLGRDHELEQLILCRVKNGR